MSMNGWEQLNCDFFASVCRDTLGSYLESKGFAEKKEDSIGALLFTRFDLFLEVGYDAHTSPDYTPSFVLGMGDRVYDDQGRMAGVPMWYILPEDHPQRTSRHWTFRTKEELKQVLAEIKDQFLEPTMESLLLNREGLERVVKNFQSEFC